MTDREKVIKEWEAVLSRDPLDAPWDLIDDTLALLKEQEAIEPDVNSEGTCTCGNCGENVGYYPVGCNTPEKLCKFCQECGTEVKWDD